MGASRESYATAQMCWRATASSEDGDDVNGWITFAYGAGGVIFDIISLWAFHRSSRKEGQSVNMFTAFLHVAADFLRSGATVCMSLLILLGGFDSTCLDAYTSLLIGLSIILEQKLSSLTCEGSLNCTADPPPLSVFLL